MAQDTCCWCIKIVARCEAAVDVAREIDGHGSGAHGVVHVEKITIDRS